MAHFMCSVCTLSVGVYCCIIFLAGFALVATEISCHNFVVFRTSQAQIDETIYIILLWQALKVQIRMLYIIYSTRLYGVYSYLMAEEVCLRAVPLVTTNIVLVIGVGKWQTFSNFGKST